ncbi:IS66 family transposase, partial [Candidatus Protofrankia californiensis]|uniref:IS66 family transposase n=1 Tax=Candidatus Protofrankia californiensis TaxID=1839754 RepID=UPI001040E594
MVAADDVTDVAYWRARAERAEAWASELGEQVAVLSRLLFGPYSEKNRPGRGGGTEEPDGQDTEGGRKPGQLRRRGQRPGSRGHGRRDYSRLNIREEIHDVPPASGCAPLREGFRVPRQRDERADRLAGDDHQDRAPTATLLPPLHLPGPRTVIAPVPPKPVPQGRFTAGFLTRLLHEKYVLGRPLHRIATALAADGLEVAEGTLCGVLQDAAGLLAPITEAIAARNAEAAHLHADETGWRVFEQAGRTRGHRWWLWVFLAPDTAVFTMDPTRSAAMLERHLGVDVKDGALPDGRHLVLSADFFTVYQALGRLDGVDPLWCWSHMRRRFVRAGDAYLQLRPWRDLWVRRIGDLYLAHRNLAAAEPGGDERAQALAAFEAALVAIDTARRQDAAIYSLHPAARKVLATLDREWEGLVRHRDFPDLGLDNNIAERALRTPVVGRKNCYGSQAEWSAHLAACVWTVTAPPPNATATNPWPTSPTTSAPVPPPAAGHPKAQPCNGSSSGGTTPTTTRPGPATTISAGPPSPAVNPSPVPHHSPSPQT